jgi:predicted PolB exonuclease-like 3'-5' exonuclease
MENNIFLKLLVIVSFFSPVEAKNLTLDQSFEDISIELVTSELNDLKKSFIQSAECKASHCLSSVATSRCDKIVKNIDSFKNVIQDVEYNLGEGIMVFSDSQKSKYENYKSEFEKLSKDSVFICGSGSGS